MLDKKDDGGLVYPGSRRENIGKEVGFESRMVNYPGITRRDWLAGLAMQAIISDHIAMEKVYKEYGNPEETAKSVAMFSYHQADAMIAESNK